MTGIYSQGYDNPVSLRDNDYLNRWSFAREVFSITDTAPSEWSIRVGVYGAWGTGKTSVLKFIESMAKGKKHIVVNFNPWPYRTTNEMWEELTKEVYQSLKIAGLEMENHNAVMLKPKARRLANLASANAEVIDEVATHIPTPYVVKGVTKTAKLGLSLLTGFLKANSQQLQKVGEVLGERRIIVLIDDLDRTDLNLLPEVLYALREVLNLPGFVFIMGFDPLVVGEALKKHHPGWGDGKRFLEKIIDFPRPLPPPTKRQLLNLVKNDVIRHSSFIDLDALENIFEFLPDNPRQLRSFIRSLWGIKFQVMRHDSKEISWENLLLVNLLKFKQPNLAYLLFQKDEQWFVDWGVSKFGGTNVAQATNRKTEVDKKFSQLCNDVGITDEQEKQNCFNIVDAIVTKNILGLDVVAIKQLALLTEEPPIFTFKEIEAILEAWIDTEDTNQVQARIIEHTNKIESTYDLVFIALFEKLVVYWDKQLIEASNVLRDEKRSSYVKQAGNVLSLLDILSFTLSGFVGEHPHLDITHFLLVLEMTDKWLHFDSTPDYQIQRKLERSFLERIAHETTLDPVLLLEALKPWDAYRGSTFHRNLSQDIYNTLDGIFEPQAAKRVSDYLQTEDISKKPDVLAYLILRQESTLWRSNSFKDSILKIVATADTLFTVQENLLKLIQLFAKKLKVECGLIIGTSGDTQVPIHPEFLHDLYIIEELWKGALSRALNPRIISAYAEYREIIRKYIDVQLAVPEFWSQWLSRIKVN